MVVDNAALENAKSAIDDASSNFKTMASAFISSLEGALSTFEGETKDVLMKDKIGTGEGTEGTLAYFLQKQVPDLIKGLGDLLEGNRTTINDSDQKLAEAISGGQG